MAEVVELAEKIYQLDTPVPGGGSFPVYLIPGGKGVVIETGPTTAIPTIQQGMKHLGMEQLGYIIPTHIHLDHAGGVGKLAELFPQTKVVLHPQGVKHLINPARLIDSTKLVFGADFEASYGPILPVSESQIKVPADEEVIDINGRELQIVYAPGHAPHHIAIFDRKTGGLFCGEALGIPVAGAEFFVLPTAPPPSFDLEDYVKSMARLRDLRPRLLFYAHDGVGRAPDKLISSAIENSRMFGDVILKAMRNGETGVAISRRIGERLSIVLGQQADALDTGMAVSGYTLYFKKKGLA